jgi:hypothetical protein
MAGTETQEPATPGAPDTPPEAPAPPSPDSGAPAPVEETSAPAPQEIHGTIDLVLGAWRPREAATQLAAAIGITLAPGLPPEPETSPVTNDRRGIDIGAVGDPIAFLAHDDAARIAAALPAAATVMVLAPRHGRGIGTLNDWLFHYLRHLALSLVIIGDEPATAIARSAFERRRGFEPPPTGRAIGEFTPEQQRLLRFFPGLLPKPIAQRYGLDPAAAALVAVGGAHFLIPPGYRDADPAIAPAALDAIEEVESLDDGLKALAQTFCTAHYADSAALATLATRAFHAGEIDLARELAVRARNVARTPAAAAAADIVRQEIRLYQRRFTEIFATPEPSRQAPEPLRERLAALRLRAAVERGERASAPAGLEAVAARLDHGRADADDLHLLALHVAARIAAGEGEVVRSLAAKIGTAAGETGDQRVTFLAALNLAALARRDEDRAAEGAALDRVHATSAGARSLAEIITMNVALARAAEDPAALRAIGAWLRAALAWLAFEPVEALPVATVETVLGTLSVAKTQLDQAVSDALASAIERAAPALAGTVDSDAPIPAIRRSGVYGLAPEKLVAGAGAAVLWTGTKAQGQPPAPSRARLIRLVRAALYEAAPAAGLDREGTILVDDDAGMDVPATREAALAVALRAGVPEAWLGKERVPIDSAVRPRLAADLRVGLSPAVAAIEGDAKAAASGGALTVRFRRHLADTTVSGREAQILAPVRDRGRMPLGSLAVLLGMPLAETERLLRDLEARRIVRVEVEGR